MKTDRELLEAAAKAAGYEHLLWTPGASPIVPGSFRVPGEKAWWNPLTDDGDALRLAVKLCLHINIEPYGSAARRQGKDWQGCESHLYGRPEAATRRAIVRAAAAMAG